MTIGQYLYKTKIVPILDKNDQELLDIKTKFNIKDHIISNIETIDGTNLQANLQYQIFDNYLFISKNNNTLSNENQKLLILFPGNNWTYQKKCELLIAKFNEKKWFDDYKIAIFNYPHDPEEMSNVIDLGAAMVQGFLDNKYKPENISFLGHSLGGGASTLVASRFIGKLPKGQQFQALINYKSFSKLSDVPIVLMEIIIKTFFDKWDLKTDEQFFKNSLPFIKKYIIYAEHDKEIPLNASLINAYKKQSSNNLTSITIFKDKCLELYKDNEHGYYYGIDELKAIANNQTDKFKNFKNFEIQK